MRTVLYLRVSTAQQKPDLQWDDLRSYAERTGLTIIAEYTDVAVSGRKEGRPQLQALMRAARAREFGRRRPRGRGPRARVWRSLAFPPFGRVNYSLNLEVFPQQISNPGRRGPSSLVTRRARPRRPLERMSDLKP